MILRPRGHNALVDHSRTITRTGDRRRAREGEKPFLFPALQCDRPLSSGARFGFAGPDAVSIDGVRNFGAGSAAAFVGGGRWRETFGLRLRLSSR